MTKKKDEDDKKSSRNIEIEKEAITKIILAPLFFNSARFNNVKFDEFDEFNNPIIKTYQFKDDDKGKSAKNLLEILKAQFNDRIFKVDKVVQDYIVYREIAYQIEIMDISNKSVTIKREIIISDR